MIVIDKPALTRLARAVRANLAAPDIAVAVSHARAMEACAAALGVGDVNAMTSLLSRRAFVVGVPGALRLPEWGTRHVLGVPNHAKVHEHVRRALLDTRIDPRVERTDVVVAQIRTRAAAIGIDDDMLSVLRERDAMLHSAHESNRSVRRTAEMLGVDLDEPFEARKSDIVERFSDLGVYLRARAGRIEGWLDLNRMPEGGTVWDDETSQRAEAVGSAGLALDKLRRHLEMNQVCTPGTIAGVDAVFQSRSMATRLAERVRLRQPEAVAAPDAWERAWTGAFVSAVVLHVEPDAYDEGDPDRVDMLHEMVTAALPTGRFIDWSAVDRVVADVAMRVRSRPAAGAEALRSAVVEADHGSALHPPSGAVDHAALVDSLAEIAERHSGDHEAFREAALDVVGQAARATGGADPVVALIDEEVRHPDTDDAGFIVSRCRGHLDADVSVPGI